MSPVGEATAGGSGGPTGTGLPRDLGFPGRVAVSWTLASGILAGGVLLAVLTLTGRQSAFGLVATSTVFFFGGAVFGFVHGSVLGWLGRGRDTTAAAGLRSVGMAGLYVLPALGVGWVVASLIAQTSAAAFSGRLLAWLGVGLAWGGAVGICLWALREGVRAVRRMLGRWEDPVPGSVLVALTLAALLTLFLSDRPQLWGTQLRVGVVGAVLLAGFATTWISGPAISLPFWLYRRRPEPRILAAPLPRGRRLALGLALGGIAGVVLAGLALWLAPSLGTAPGIRTTGAGPANLLALSASHALVDEVLFRLSALGSVVWLLRRWHPVHPEEATVVGVVLAAVLQTLAYGPAFLGQGLPDPGALMMQVVWVVSMPSLVLGALFVAGGLPASFTAAMVFRFLLGTLGG